MSAIGSKSFCPTHLIINMELEQLRAFVAVAEEKSYTKAGERLYMSHSTMSRAVSALEREFGCRLIERDTHVVGLTADGERLCAMAKELLEKAQELENSMRGS